MLQDNEYRDMMLAARTKKYEEEVAAMQRQLATLKKCLFGIQVPTPPTTQVCVQTQTKREKEEKHPMTIQIEQQEKETDQEAQNWLRLELEEIPELMELEEVNSPEAIAWWDKKLVATEYFNDEYFQE